MRRRYVALLAVGFTASPAVAPAAEVPGFVLRTWSVSDGLPQSSITSIAQDRDGFLWMGTFGGLVRFDGVQFRTFSPDNEPAFTSKSVLQVWSDRSDRLWISTEGGIVWRENGRFVRGPEKARKIIRFAEGHDGRVIASARGGRIFAFRGSEVTELAPPAPGCSDERIDVATVVADFEGQVWGERCRTIFRLDGDRWTSVATLSRADERRSVIEGFGRRLAGGVWIATPRWIYALNDGRPRRVFERPEPVRSKPAYVNVHDLGPDGLWTVSLTDGAVRYLPGEAPLALRGDGVLPHRAVRCVFRDRESHLWFGTDGGGLAQLRRAPVQTWSRSEGLGEKIVRRTRVGVDGNLWIATHGRGVWRFDGRRFDRPIDQSGSPTTPWVWALHVGPKDGVWAGFLQDGARRVGPRPARAALPGWPTTVYDITANPDGKLYFATSRGLYAGDAAHLELALPVAETGSVSVVLRSGNEVWAGTQTGKIFIEGSDGWEEIGPTPLRGQPIRSLRFDLDGEPWAVVDVGLATRHAGHWVLLGAQHGLRDGPWTDVAFEANGRIWVGGKSGVTGFERTALLQAARGGPPAEGVGLNLSDGLRSLEITSIDPWRTGGRDLLVMSTLDGISIFDPERLVLPSAPPRVVIDAVRYHRQDASHPSLLPNHHSTRVAPDEGRLELPAGSDHVSIELSAPSFADPEAVRFDVRMEGPTGVYRSVTKERSVHLHSPRVGTYRIEVHAVTHHGKRSEVPAVLEFRIAPTIAESRWLVPSVAVVALGILALLFARRSRRLQLVAARERELRQAEQKYRQLDRQLLETQRLESLGLLAGGVAHDFNNILTGILANAELLREARIDVEDADLVDGIIGGSRRAAELCENMLAYSGRGQHRPETIDLNAIVVETIRLVQASVRPDVQFELDLAPGVLAVEADASQIRQVVMNLATNASEAVPAGRARIEVRSHRRPALSYRRLEAAVLRPVEPDQPFCCVEVVDHGEGMDSETRERIFEPFFTTKSTGRGLGLAATLGIVQGHGGALFVESNPGEGSVFRLCLPASQNAPAAQLVDENTPSSEIVVRRVLVVDDEAAVRRIIQRAFRRMNFLVHEASGGAEAIEAFGNLSGSFDLVFLDLTMPEMDGAEVLQRIRVIAPKVPVVIMSGYARRDALERVGSQPRVAFLQKPFGLEDLMRAADAAVPSASMPDV
jgi:signal transduction histidine kinase/ligand-binding sensor domain-containing protein/CheY-like chemotaxis protein